MNNQKLREANEIDSPNAELFKSLSQLYDVDIQDLTQFQLASFRNPELDEAAIEIIKASRMFKHMDDVMRDIPWIMDDTDFLNHYKDSDAALHFLYSKMNHYDHTILPCYKELHLQTIAVAMKFPKSKVAIFLRDYIKQMVEDAVTCRKRFEELYVVMFHERQQDFVRFIEKYGFYTEFEYVNQPTDISFILHDMMKASFKSENK